MFRPIFVQKLLNTPVEPVKWIPANPGRPRTSSVIATASPATRLMTPGGSPASSKSFIT